MQLKSCENLYLIGETKSLSRELVKRVLHVKGITLVDNFLDNETIQYIVGTALSSEDNQLVKTLPFVQCCGIAELEAYLMRSLSRVQIEKLIVSSTVTIKALLKNAYLSDENFLFLLSRYRFEGATFFETSKNEEVMAAFLQRFALASTSLSLKERFIQYLMVTTQKKILERITQLSPIQTFLLQGGDAYTATVVKVLMQHECLDARWIRKAFKHSEVIDELISSCHFSQAITQFLIAQEDEALTIKLASQPTISIEVEEALKDRYANYIAQYCQMSDDRFSCYSVLEPEALAKNSSLSVEQQEKLYAMQRQAVHLALAQNSSVDVAIQHRLMQLDDEAIAYQLACNSATHQDILLALIANNHLHVSLAMNSGASSDVREALLSETDNLLVLEALEVHGAISEPLKKKIIERKQLIVKRADCSESD